MSDGDPMLPGMDTLTPPTVVVAPMVWGPPPVDTITRFWAKVIPTADCWWWTGAVSYPDGYGRISWTQDGARRTLSAHRFALLLAAGTLDHHTFGEHHCNETLCVRVDPTHLHPGTQSANLRYAVSLGRHRGCLPTDIDPRGRHGPHLLPHPDPAPVRPEHPVKTRFTTRFCRCPAVISCRPTQRHRSRM